MSEQIKVIVDPKGNTTVEAEGFTGQACTDKTRQIIEALGSKKDREDFKPEFFAENQQEQQISNG